MNRICIKQMFICRGFTWVDQIKSNFIIVIGKHTYNIASIDISLLGTKTQTTIQCLAEICNILRFRIVSKPQPQKHDQNLNVWLKFALYHDTKLYQLLFHLFTLFFYS